MVHASCKDDILLQNLDLRNFPQKRQVLPAIQCCGQMDFQFNYVARSHPQELEAGESTTILRTAIDLFCGAGGLTEGFNQSGFRCVYANDSNASAVETFKYNHPDTWADLSPIELVNARS